MGWCLHLFGLTRHGERIRYVSDLRLPPADELDRNRGYLLSPLRSQTTPRVWATGGLSCDLAHGVLSPDGAVPDLDGALHLACVTRSIPSPVVQRVR